MKKILVEVNNFHISFGSKSILKNVTFKLYEGECLALIGASGEGKSVLLRSLVGLEKPDKGQIIIEDEDVTQFDEEEFLKVRKKLAYAFQGGALFESMTVYDNLAFPLREHTSLNETSIQKIIQRELEDLNLSGCEERYPQELSGGMQKRVGVARAIIMSPKIILYDEPTTGLDPYNTKKMENIILRLKKRGATSILVTHDMLSAQRVCDRVALLMGGNIRARGTPKDLEKSHNKLIRNFIEGIKEAGNGQKNSKKS